MKMVNIFDVARFQSSADCAYSISQGPISQVMSHIGMKRDSVAASLHCDGVLPSVLLVYKIILPAVAPFTAMD